MRVFGAGSYNGLLGGVVDPAGENGCGGRQLNTMTRTRNVLLSG